MPDECAHARTIRNVTPSALGCEECLKLGSTWVHLRLCRTCGTLDAWNATTCSSLYLTLQTASFWRWPVHCRWWSGGDHFFPRTGTMDHWDPLVTGGLSRTCLTSSSSSIRISITGRSTSIPRYSSLA